MHGLTFRLPHARGEVKRGRFVLAAVLLLGAALGRAAPSGFILEIEAANLQGGAGQLFYDIGQWYSVRDSSRVEMPAGTTLRPYRFAIPPKPVRHLRFDPIDGAGTVQIGRMRLLTKEGELLTTFGPEHLVPMHSILGLRIEDGVAIIETSADDPMVLIARPLQRETARALGRAVVGPGEIAVLGLTLAVLVITGIWVVVRAVRQNARQVADGVRGNRTTWILAGSFLVVFGARLFWLKHYSRPMPFWDEWKTGAIDLVIPLRGGFLDWETLFLPHGEHRILFTRLLTLMGALANGEWDPRVSMAASAALFAAGIALLCGALGKAGPRWGVALAMILAAWASLPFDVRNVYWGDQSQMYAVCFFGICTLVIAASEKVVPVVWLGGGAAALVSLFTMGSGFVAAGLGAAICAARWRGEVEQRRPLAVMGLIFLVATIIGACLYRAAPFQGPGYARTWAQFWPAFVGRAAWPLPPRLIWTTVIWLPWTVLCAFTLMNRRAGFLDWLALGIGGWALVNAIGLAHGRPQDAPPFDSKYYTAMSMTVAGTILSAGALLTQWPARRVWPTLGLVSALAAAAAMAPVGMAGVRGSKSQFTDRLANDDFVRPFLATGNPGPLRATSWHQLPYWNGAELADLLDSPLLQPWLPAALRDSLTKRSDSPIHGPQSPGPITMGVRALMKAGLFLFIAGCGVLLAMAATAMTRRER